MSNATATTTATTRTINVDKVFTTNQELIESPEYHAIFEGFQNSDYNFRKENFIDKPKGFERVAPSRKFYFIRAMLSGKDIYVHYTTDDGLYMLGQIQAGSMISSQPFNEITIDIEIGDNQAENKINSFTIHARGWDKSNSNRRKLSQMFTTVTGLHA